MEVYLIRSNAGDRPTGGHLFLQGFGTIDQAESTFGTPRDADGYFSEYLSQRDVPPPK
jgi:hypothetical protein